MRITHLYQARKQKMCSKKWVLYNFVSFGMGLLLSDIKFWSWSSFWVTVHASWVLCRQKIDRVLRTHPFTDCNQAHLCRKCSLHSLNMTLFQLFWYLWPTMASKMSEEFPTVSLDITAKVTNLLFPTVSLDITAKVRNFRPCLWIIPQSLRGKAVSDSNQRQRDFQRHNSIALARRLD